MAEVGKELDARPNPTMHREFMDDVVSIKLSQVETLLEEKEKELKDQLEEQGKACEKAVELLKEYCNADAQEQVGSKLESIVKAFNASELFPEMDYNIGSGYGAYDVTKEDDYGVGVEIVVKEDKNTQKIARGGLPVTTSGRARQGNGLKVIAGTTALIKLTDRVKSQQIVVTAENEKKSTLDKQIDKVRTTLRNMSSSERKIRAAVAKNHLTQNEQGKQAIEFLDQLGLSDALGKDAAKLLPSA
jgi:thymidine phosphorylase